jgi:hypothetical protein
VKARTYDQIGAFLNKTRADLESNEAANSLMLGLCGQFQHHPDWLRAAPCLKTVEDQNGLVLAVLMTPPHNLLVYHHRGDLAGAVRILVEELIRDGWTVPGVLGPSEAAGAVAQAWTEATDVRCTLVREQPLYELREVRSLAPVPGRLRLAVGRDVDLVSRWLHQFVLGVFGKASREESDRTASRRIEERDVYLWEDGRPVSMAMKTRPTRHGISISYVYTPPGSRRQGYATACVAELSTVLLAAGWEFCTLFADLANGTANRIYRKIGYRPVCDYQEYAFTEDG